MLSGGVCVVLTMKTAFTWVPEIGLKTLIGGSDAHNTFSMSLIHNNCILEFQLIYSICS